jgi:hypothetical protein
LPNVAFNEAGNYSVIVSNAAGVVVSAPASLVVMDLANLTPYTPAGWSDGIVAAIVPGSTVDAAVIHDNQDIYVSWAILNGATNGDINVRFYTQLYLDGTLNQTWNTDGLLADFYTYVTNYNLGKLSQGTHTLRIDTDTTRVVNESNENDNSYTKTLTITSTNSNPVFRLLSPSYGPNGAFRFTFQGINGLNFEIQTSSNLVNWSVLAIISDTNANGALPVIDPSTSSNHRYYRARLRN